jgi:hypothetical protein
MAKWLLGCKNCKRDFEYSQIGDTLANLYLPEKPEFPLQGLELECPHCNTKGIYYRRDLAFDE